MAAMADLALELSKAAGDAGIKTVYGDPVTIEGTTLIPVALAYYGFGAGTAEGEASGSGSGGKGSGGGGGGLSIPIGAYVGKDGETHFEPNVISLLAVSIPFVWVAGNALAKLVKVLKK
ncbi:hypothetical protein ARHIZOSPH14_29410 [Agromyces rhizosphaerae]|uniref:Sporulation protein YtfJ n=2 Tax=Agromyces rhizosphaerae TaxID=88374 RepID=A0A9W6CXQ8_9MICO|nr:hypothetical protein ARHIZOSPH14_29410 [Agromyces rhizosphaerae]